MSISNKSLLTLVQRGNISAIQASKIIDATSKDLLLGVQNYLKHAEDAQISLEAYLKAVPVYVKKTKPNRGASIDVIRGEDVTL